jgi:hypothetical protein
MSESLVYKGSLEGHGGWVTAIATSSENPDMILTASRGAFSGVEMECNRGKGRARGRRNGMGEDAETGGFNFGNKMIEQDTGKDVRDRKDGKENRGKRDGRPVQDLNIKSLEYGRNRRS